MDHVEIFQCVYLELQPDGSRARHTASFTLLAPFGDFVALMMSPLGMSAERAAEEHFQVVLDLTASEVSAAVYEAGYTVASPQFMAGFAGTVEERTVELASDFRALIDPVYACSAITYSSVTQ